jgi:site-specific recombinase XerD
MWLHHWTRSLESDNRADKTILSYTRAYKLFSEWCGERGIDDPVRVTRRDVRDYFAAYAERKNQRTGAPMSPNSIAMDYRNLRVFFNWVEREEDVTGYTSPMRNVKQPAVPKRRVATFTIDEVRAMLATCRGNTFEDRRDTAIIRLLVDAGPRRAELAGMGVTDLNQGNGTAVVIGKGRGGGSERVISYGHKTAKAIDRYLRARDRHRDAAHPALWLAVPGYGGSGEISDNGISQMLRRRARQAGVANVHAHRFRHTSYGLFMRGGGDGTSAMTLYGWESEAMLRHYASLDAEDRALTADKRISHADAI